MEKLSLTMDKNLYTAHGADKNLKSDLDSTTTLKNGT